MFTVKQNSSTTLLMYAYTVHPQICLDNYNGIIGKCQNIIK